MKKGVAVATDESVLFLLADDRFVVSHAVSRNVRWVTDLEHIWACDVMFGSGASTRRLAP